MDQEQAREQGNSRGGGHHFRGGGFKMGDFEDMFGGFGGGFGGGFEDFGGFGGFGGRRKGRRRQKRKSRGSYDFNFGNGGATEQAEETNTHFKDSEVEVINPDDDKYYLENISSPTAIFFFAPSQLSDKLEVKINFN